MPSSIEIPAAKRMVLAVRPSIYDASTGGYRSGTLYFTSPKEKVSSWVSPMLRAQRSGLWVPLSAEWYQGRESVLANYGEGAERDFIEGTPEWTGTVFDYDHEEILEDIRFRDAPEDEIIENPYAFIESAARLGARDNVFLPQESGCVCDFPERYMKAVAHAWGVKDIRELPPHTYLHVSPGFRPLVRGDWIANHRDNRRVLVNANYGPASRGFAARFVSRTRPNAITPAAYQDIERRLDDKEAELKALAETQLRPLREELDAAVVLIE